MAKRQPGPGGAPPNVGGGGDGRRSPGDSRSFLDQQFSTQEFPSSLKELVHPGKKGDPQELLMRCILKDERERNAAVLYYAKCKEFGLKEEMEVLNNWLASTVSIRGIARREFLMGHTGIIAPTLYDEKGKKKWSWRSRDGDRDGKDGNE